LTLEDTHKAVGLARVGRLAVNVFGDTAKAHRWLHKPKKALGGETPLACLRTEAGARIVEEMLHRIDHGILASLREGASISDSVFPQRWSLVA
jgi:putative toxin-antitoxin system antitoxin component (TIGR02293 family)